MKALCWLAMLVGLMGLLDVSQAQDKKDRVFVIDGLKSEAPADWVVEKPSNRLRYLQFRLPKAEGDAVDAELVITKGIGGAADANIKRWKDQFIPPEGKVTEMKLGKGKAWYLDITGTYLYKAAPFDPNAKVEKRPDQRMIAIHYEGEDDPYHFRLVGPAKTVDKYKKGFDGWINGLK
jgi:hypothetical protein